MSIPASYGLLVDFYTLAISHSFLRRVLREREKAVI